MKPKLMILFLMLIPAILTTGQARAQGTGDQERERLRGAIIQTDEIIERAKEVVAESGSERASIILKSAIRLQEMSYATYEEALMRFDTVYVQFVQLSNRQTIEARIKAQQAIAITRQAGENENYVRGKLEQTEEMIRRMEGGGGEAASLHLRQALEAVREKQTRAIELFRNRRLKAALQLALQVEKSLEEARRQAGQTDQAQQRYLTLSERYRTIQDQLQATITAAAESGQLLENAERLRAEAEDYYTRSEYRQAEQAMQKAQEILQRLSEDLRNPARIETALGQIEKQMERFRDLVQAEDNPHVQNQYEDAHRHLVKARQFYQNGQYGAAAAQLQAARQIMQQITEQVGE